MTNKEVGPCPTSLKQKQCQHPYPLCLLVGSVLALDPRSRQIADESGRCAKIVLMLLYLDLRVLHFTISTTCTKLLIQVTVDFYLF